MKSFLNYIFIATIVILISGCTIKGKVYSPNLDTVNELQDKNLKEVKIKHNKGAQVVYEIPVGRGTNVMSSPYTTFQEYLEKALTQNLILSNLYSENSNISIKATLLDNKLDTGLSVGTATVSANFKILENDTIKLDKRFQVYHTWDSNFVAAIAIPRTIDNYVIAMQKLVDKFLLDDEALKVLKK